MANRYPNNEQEKDVGSSGTQEEDLDFEIERQNEQGFCHLQDTASSRPKRTKRYSSSDDEEDWIPVNQAFQDRIVHHCEFLPFNLGISQVQHSDLITLIKSAERRNISVKRLVQRIIDAHDSPNIWGNSIGDPENEEQPDSEEERELSHSEPNLL